jgi:orotate phosphoribosyltransferase
MSKEHIIDILMKEALNLEGPFEFANLSVESPMKMEVDRILRNKVNERIIGYNLSALMTGSELSSVGGVATGGMPWAFWVSDFLDIPKFWIKKDRSINGADVEFLGNYPGLVEDVVTSGLSLDNSVRGLERYGLDPRVASVFSYGWRKDVPALVCFEDIVERLPREKVDEILRWYGEVKIKYGH